MFRKHMAKKPCDVMDKLMVAFVKRFKDLLGDNTTSVGWDNNYNAAIQLINWAVLAKCGDFDREDAKILELLLENAAALEREK